MLAATIMPGNPSSVHGAGRAARRILEDARDRIAAKFGACASNVVFTSGATESISLATHAWGKGRRLIRGATEHDAVRAAVPDAAVIPVDADGRLDLDALSHLLDGPAALVFAMLANNETGTLQNMPAIAQLCRSAGALLVVDTVQAAGRMPVDIAALGADAIVVSSHKLGGPMGAGALVTASGGPPVRAMLQGGGQERGQRGGTPALPAIAGFAAAVAEPLRDLAALRDEAETAAVGAGAVVIGGGAPRIDNTTCLALPGVRSDTQVIALDLAGIAVSAGAACSSGKVARSHVIEAMGLGALAGEAIRVSLPWTATAADVASFGVAYAAMAARLAGPSAVRRVA